MKELLIFIGGFIGMLALFALVNWLHDRWAWRQSVREVEAMRRAYPAMCRRPPPK